MCPAEVLKEIEIRGYKDTYIYDPKKPPTAKDHIHGPKTISEDSFFRGVLMDLQERTKELPIPPNRITLQSLSQIGKKS